MSLEANVMSIDVVVSDGVKYSTSEYEYHKKLRVGVLILKNVIEHEYHKKVWVPMSTFASLAKEVFKL